MLAAVGSGLALFGTAPAKAETVDAVGPICTPDGAACADYDQSTHTFRVGDRVCDLYLAYAQFRLGGSSAGTIRTNDCASAIAVVAGSSSTITYRVCTTKPNNCSAWATEPTS
jgi:hypothetical protein